MSQSGVEASYTTNFDHKIHGRKTQIEGIRK